MAVAKSCENDLLATEMEIVNYFQAAVSKWLSFSLMRGLAWRRQIKLQ